MIPALILAIALAMPPASHQTPAAAPKPCVGVVVRTINPGVEIVKQKSGKLCQRPAGAQPSQTKVKR